METQDEVQKPKTVATAVNLLWAFFAVELVKMPMSLSHLSAVAPDTVIKNYVPFCIFRLIVFAFLIFKISSGKNWVRIAFLVISVHTLFGISGEFSWSPVVGTLSVVQVCLQAYALLLLFTRPGSVWFQEGLLKNEQPLNLNISPGKVSGPFFPSGDVLMKFVIRGIGSYLLLTGVWFGFALLISGGGLLREGGRITLVTVAVYCVGGFYSGIQLLHSKSSGRVAASLLSIWALFYTVYDALRHSHRISVPSVVVILLVNASILAVLQVPAVRRHFDRPSGA